MSARCVSSRTDSMAAWEDGGAGGGIRVACPGMMSAVCLGILDRSRKKEQGKQCSSGILRRRRSIDSANVSMICAIAMFRP